MSNFESRNLHPEFDALVEERLGRYVYVLYDGGTPFYVGKGGGSTGKGNKLSPVSANGTDLRL